METYLRHLLARVCDGLTATHAGVRTGLRFPVKRDLTTRISEQESKHLFTHHLLLDARYSFSVETPTRESYVQSGTTPISARIDLSLYDEAGAPVVHVELKAHVCDTESIRKDLEKLLREGVAGLWFHTLGKSSPRALRVLAGRFRAAFALLPGGLAENSRSHLFALFVLEKQALYLRWVRFTGDSAENTAAVAAAFRDEAPFGDWERTPPATEAAPRPVASGKGRGQREAFFVYAPAVNADSVLHLSIRGGSYRLREYSLDQTGAGPRCFMLPGVATVQSLREGNQIAEWIPVEADDYDHNVDTDPDYWRERILAVNARRGPG